MDTFRPELESCPICRSKGNCHIHAYYGRKMVDFIHGKPVWTEITALRLICDSCLHTHAVLPDLIIPYSSYGLFFILRVLAEYFAGFSTVERLCERFCITQNQLYKWRKLWRLHKQEWLGLLDSMEVSDPGFLKRLSIKMEYSVFASAFVHKCGRSFLQSHRNPAYP